MSTLRDVMNACLSFSTQFFTLSQIVELTGQNRSEARHRLWKLEGAGLITRVKCWEMSPTYEKGKPANEMCYRNTRLLDKRAAARPAKKENGWDKMWRTVRALRRFTRLDLMTICGQTEHNVREFTKTYRDLGYIRCHGMGGPKVTWSIAKDSGAKRPKAGRRSGRTGKMEGSHVD